MRSIKVDEETYKLLLKLKYEHAMRGIKLTFSDLVKRILLGSCHSSNEGRKPCDINQNDMKEAKLRKITT
ncbi:MAG: hypothetical protein ACTSYM_07350 [Candidatus Baldrarchaeia archaeon]